MLANDFHTRIGITRKEFESGFMFYLTDRFNHIHIVSTNTFETKEESLEAAKRVMLAINSPSRMRYIFEDQFWPDHKWYFYRRVL